MDVEAGFFQFGEDDVLAELELNSESAVFEHPSWLGMEVTGDMKYSNSYLARHPYGTWKASGSIHPEETA